MSNPNLSVFTIPVKMYGDLPFDIVIESTDSNGEISYTSSDESVATVSGNTVTIVGVGEITIYVTQSATDDYLLETANITLIVNKATPKLSLPFITKKTYGTAPFQITATSISNGLVNYVSSNLNVATVSGNTVTIVGLGSSIITATQYETATYNSATASRTLNVADLATASRTLKVADLATASRTLKVADLATASRTLRVADLATASRTLRVADLAKDSKTLRVNKANPNIRNFVIPTKILGNIPFVLDAPVTDSPSPFSYSTLNTDVATISENIVTIVAVGPATIEASQVESANYLSGTINGLLTVDNATAENPPLVSTPEEFVYVMLTEAAYVALTGSMTVTNDLTSPSEKILLSKDNLIKITM